MINTLKIPAKEFVLSKATNTKPAEVLKTELFRGLSRTASFEGTPSNGWFGLNRGKLY